MGHNAVSAVKPLLFPDDQTNQLKGALPKFFSELSEPYNFIFSGGKNKCLSVLFVQNALIVFSPQPAENCDMMLV